MLVALHSMMISFLTLQYIAKFQFHPGKNVGLGKDHTIFSLIDGLVKFEKFGPDKKKVNLEFWMICIFMYLLILDFSMTCNLI